MTSSYLDKRPRPLHEVIASRSSITMRAFAPNGGPTMTVVGTSRPNCLDRLKRICRDYRLPLRRTMATARRVKSAIYDRPVYASVWRRRR